MIRIGRLDVVVHQVDFVGVGVGLEFGKTLRGQIGRIPGIAVTRTDVRRRHAGPEVARRLGRREKDLRIAVQRNLGRFQRQRAEQVPVVCAGIAAEQDQRIVTMEVVGEAEPR